MTPHHFYDENTLVREGSGRSGVHGLHDPVKSRVRPDRHVSATKIVVYWAYHPDNVEMAEFQLLVSIYFTWNKIGVIKDGFIMYLSQVTWLHKTYVCNTLTGRIHRTFKPQLRAKN